MKRTFLENRYQYLFVIVLGVFVLMYGYAWGQSSAVADANRHFESKIVDMRHAYIWDLNNLSALAGKPCTLP